MLTSEEVTLRARSSAFFSCFSICFKAELVPANRACTQRPTLITIGCETAVHTQTPAIALPGECHYAMHISVPKQTALLLCSVSLAEEAQSQYPGLAEGSDLK